MDAETRTGTAARKFHDLCIAEPERMAGRLAWSQDRRLEIVAEDARRLKLREAKRREVLEGGRVIEAEGKPVEIEDVPFVAVSRALARRCEKTEWWRLPPRFQRPLAKATILALDGRRRRGPRELVSIPVAYIPPVNTKPLGELATMDFDRFELLSAEYQQAVSYFRLERLRRNLVSHPLPVPPDEDVLGTLRHLRDKCPEPDPDFVERMLAIVEEDLARASAEHGRGPATRPTPPPKPAGPTPGESAVWEALCGRCLTARELALPECVNTSETVVRLHVQALRSKKGPASIGTKKGGGYFRPDAPPDWDTVQPKRQRRLRPA